MRKVKILHVHTLPAITGSGIRTLIVMKGLDKAGYEVEFACAPGGSLINKIEMEGIKFRLIKHFVQKINPYNDLNCVKCFDRNGDELNFKLID